jgi:alkylated DNA repair dioxygenase AlkB
MLDFGESGLEAVPIQDGDLLFQPRCDLGIDPEALFDTLMAETAWREEMITVFGRRHLQPRLIAWYGDPAARYTYSGIQHDPLPWTTSLASLRDRLQALTGAAYNSVLLNLYRNERDSMGLHADDEPELGPEPVIASVSLGEQRSLCFQHRHRRDVKNLNLPLPSGSLLVMRGATQRNWKHGLRKLSRPCGPRINLTFRWIDPDYRT